MQRFYYGELTVKRPKSEAGEPGPYSDQYDVLDYWRAVYVGVDSGCLVLWDDGDDEKVYNTDVPPIVIYGPGMWVWARNAHDPIDPINSVIAGR